MSQQTLNNGETGEVIRGKINDNFTELYTDKLTSAEKTSLTGGANSTDHYHDADRSCDNHVGGSTNTVFLVTDKSKLDGVESGATADQTGSEIKTLYEAETNTNAYTDAEKTKLAGVESGAEVNNISDVNAGDLTDSGDSSLHYHSADRNCDNHVSGSTNKVYTSTEQTKLAGIATGATANDTDANLKNRANHTGTQTASTISDFDTEVSNNASVTANTAKVTNANHTGEVTGDGALTIASDVVDEDNLKTENSSTDGYVLTATPGSTSGLIWKQLPLQSFVIACSDEATDLVASATPTVTFRMPYAFTVSEVRASVTTAPTGSAIQVDINESGSSILSTKLTIDATEKTSETASVPVVISDTSLADDAEITIDIDSVGSTIAGAGLKVSIIGRVT